jgi:hypothetical protein
MVLRADTRLAGSDALPSGELRPDGTRGGVGVRSNRAGWRPEGGLMRGRLINRPLPVTIDHGEVRFY